MTCPHQSRTRDRGQFACALGWYGGRPWLGNCSDCMARGDNTPEAKALFDVNSDLNERGGLYDPQSPGESAPTIESMVKSAAESAKKWVASGLQLADEEVLRERLKACRECEFWNPQGFRGTGRCMKCGCSTWAKLRMATEKCPVGKWGPVSHTTNKP